MAEPRLTPAGELREAARLLRERPEAAAWNPAVMAAFAGWLDAAADHADAAGLALHALTPGPLAAARAVLGTGQSNG